MKEYDVVAIGTGSGTNIVSQLVAERPELDIAVVENDIPGGICLTRGCIPSKMILYPAEMVNHVREAKKFGIDVKIKNVDFSYVMKRMRNKIDNDIKSITHGLKSTDGFDFYHSKGEFIDDYTMDVGGKKIRGDIFILGAGSRPSIPPVKGLKEVGYLNSKSLLHLDSLPKSVVVVGGGYIAAEYGYFLAMMGADVTIVGRNQQFVPEEEPEVSDLLKSKLSKYMKIYTGFEVNEASKGFGKKLVKARGKDGDEIEVKANEILIATGRRSNSDILKPEKTGVKTDERGWIKVNEYLQTSKKNIYSLGDATGKYMFKHMANKEVRAVYQNAFGDGEKIKVDYHAVPHAIFTYPEVATVGMKEKEAKEKHDVLIGYYKYEDTGKGEAMGVKDYFVKVIVESKTYRILGAHIIGPQASVLIQEIINLMYTDDRTFIPIYRSMHIHPALSEVVERAFYNLHSHE
ncbi:MAG: dihydrolipoyl dehydrogenase [Thermoplasmata archaeon]